MSETDHASFLEALLAVQSEAPTLHKGETAKIPLKSGKEFSYKYIGLDTVMENVLPILSKHGLVWLTYPTSDAHGNPALRYELKHAKTNEGVEDTMPLLLKERDPQAQGSGITYARRYSLMAVLGLVADEDDDGAKATHRRAPVTQQQNGHSEYVNPEDVKALASAATGLTAGQIRLAITSVGASYPDPKDKESGIFALVPQDKAATLAKALAGANRETAA